MIAIVWVQAHYQVILAVAYGIANIGNALAAYPKVAAPFEMLHKALDFVSVLTRKDSPGTIKLPLMSSRNPNGIAIKHLVLIPLCLCSALAVSGCSPGEKAKWTAAGIDVAQCLAPAVEDAAASAIGDLVSMVDGGQYVAFADIGKALAVKYGVSASACAVGKLYYDLFTAPTHGQMSRVAVAVSYLATHQGEWLK